MKKIIVMAMCIALLGFAASAFAQVKIGTVDLARSLGTSDAGEKARAELEAFEKERVDKIVPLREELAKLDRELSAQEKVLTESARKARIETLQKKAMEVENLARTYNAEVQKKEQELSAKILRELEQIIKEVAVEGKYTTILQKQAVVYSADSTDITDIVIERYNKKQK